MERWRKEGGMSEAGMRYEWLGMETKGIEDRLKGNTWSGKMGQESGERYKQQDLSRQLSACTMELRDK